MRWIASGGIGLLLSFGLSADEPSGIRKRKAGSPAPIYLLASQSGQPTLDRGKTGGNPFGSALVHLLGRPQLAFGNLLAEIVELTEQNSRGRQRPDVPTKVASPLDQWQIRPKDEREKRVALVLVFADYSGNETMQSLPGANSDLERVAAALEGAGFATTRAIDPSIVEMQTVLDRFATQSAQADVAVLYATGHGVEIDQVIYLLPGDFSLGEAKIEERGIRLSALGDKLKAKKLNLVFYGGCRTAPSKVEPRAP